MALATHGDGPVAALRAFASQIHPVFMLPPLSASLFGGLLAASTAGVPFDRIVAAVHVLAAFFALYTAHVKDGYVDFYGREEDDDHPLTARGCRVALAGASVAFVACLAAVWWLAGPVAASHQTAARQATKATDAPASATRHPRAVSGWSSSSSRP